MVLGVALGKGRYQYGKLTAYDRLRRPWTGYRVVYEYSTFSRMFLSLAIIVAQCIAMQRALHNLVLPYFLFLIGVVFCKSDLGIYQVERVPAKVIFQERICISKRGGT